MPNDLSVWSMVLDASPIVQAVVALLLLASVASWAIIFRKSRVISHSRRTADQFESQFWSGGDLAALYRDEELPALPVRFADHAARERQRVLAAEEEYWRATLAGYETTRFPADRPRPLLAARKAARAAATAGWEPLAMYLECLMAASSRSSSSRRRRPVRSHRRVPQVTVAIDSVAWSRW